MKIKLVSILSVVIFLNACNTGYKESRLNEEASIEETNLLSVNPLLEHPLTSSINVKEGTMSTLYGNKVAWEYAILKNDGNYPPKAVLYEVTWNQKPDSVWFGANIPKVVKSLERITYLSNGTAKYDLYEGRPLRKSESEQDTTRPEIISRQRIAVSP